VPCAPAPCFGNYLPLVLDVSDFSTTPGQQIEQWTENNGTNQQWQLHPVLRKGAISPGIALSGWTAHLEARVPGENPPPILATVCVCNCFGEWDILYYS
jgi:hypothetical protein